MEIVNYCESAQGAKEIAIFGVYFGSSFGLTYNFIKLKRGKHGLFLSHPNKASGETDNLTWTPYLEFSPEKKKSFDTKVMELLKPYVASQENL